MKKRLMILAGSLLAIAAVATTVVGTNSNDDMSLLIKNVEALADGEADVYCTGPRNWGHCQSNNSNPCRDESACHP